MPTQLTMNGAAAAAADPAGNRKRSFVHAFTTQDGCCEGCGKAVAGSNATHAKRHMLKCEALLDGLNAGHVQQPSSLECNNLEELQRAMDARRRSLANQTRLAPPGAAGAAAPRSATGSSAATAEDPATSAHLCNQGGASTSGFVTRVPRAIVQQQINAVKAFPAEAGLAFHVVDTPAFRKLVLTLAPHLKDCLPSGKQAANEVSNLYQQTKAAVQAVIDKAPVVFLMLDSWTARDGRNHLIGVTVLANGTTVTIGAVATNGASETGDYIVREVLNNIDQFPGLKDKIGGVVTDWGSNFRSAATKLVDDSSLPKCLLSIGCMQHATNLALKDCAKECTHECVGGCSKPDDHFPEIVSILNHCKSVIKFFRSKVAVRAIYTAAAARRGGTQLVQPGKTRFASMLLMIKSYVDNHKVLLEVADSDEWATIYAAANNQDKAVMTAMATLIKDLALLGKAAWLYNTLQPALVFIKQLESDKSALADAYFGQLNLRAHFAAITHTYTTMMGLLLRVDESLPAEVRELARSVTPRIEAIFTKRFSDSTSEAHIVAATLDPRYYHRKEEIPCDDITTATATIDKLATKLGVNKQQAASELMSYRSSLTALGLSETQAAGARDASARVVWDNLQPFAPNLHAVAGVVVFAPPASAAVERLFSAAGHLCTAKRNRMSVERLRQLLFVFFNARAVLRSGAHRNGKEFAEFDEWLSSLVEEGVDEMLAYASDPATQGAEEGAEDDDEPATGDAANPLVL